MLDLEWAGAVARNATIIYVYGTDVWAAAQEAIDRISPRSSLPALPLANRNPPIRFAI